MVECISCCTDVSPLTACNSCFIKVTYSYCLKDVSLFFSKWCFLFNVNCMPIFYQLVVLLITITCSSSDLHFSAFSCLNMHQPWHFPPSPQQPLFPAGVSTHSVHTTVHITNYIYLLTTMKSSHVHLPWQKHSTYQNKYVDMTYLNLLSHRMADDGFWFQVWQQVNIYCNVK